MEPPDWEIFTLENFDGLRLLLVHFVLNDNRHAAIIVSGQWAHNLKPRTDESARVSVQGNNLV